ncbi:MAG: hypothetical protein KDE34_17710 [Anaerolineales bacterium]|nr:hypothetical protein [Anaerolineales bacterium]
MAKGGGDDGGVVDGAGVVMEPVNAGYDEEEALALYVWQHFRHLLSESEQIVATVVDFFDERRRAGFPAFSDAIMPVDGKYAELVITSLADGPEAFRTCITRKILSDHGSEIWINRCPACTSVASAPNSLHRVWCGHSWPEKA